MSSQPKTNEELQAELESVRRENAVIKAQIASGLLAGASEIQSKLAAIVESSDDAIVGKNLDGIVTSWNRGAERIFGYTAEQIVGRHINTIIPEDRQDEEPKILHEIRNGRRIDHFETVRKTQDGKLINISVTISPIRDGSGKIVGASKIARDITHQKRIEAELKQAKQ